MTSLEEFKKYDFRIGEIKGLSKDKIIIVCNDKEYETKIKIKAQKGDKIMVLIKGDKIEIPLAKDNLPISPEKDIKEGSRIR